MTEPDGTSSPLEPRLRIVEVATLVLALVLAVGQVVLAAQMKDIADRQNALTERAVALAADQNVLQARALELSAVQNDLAERTAALTDVLVELEADRDRSDVRIDALKVEPDGSAFQLYVFNAGLRGAQLGSIDLDVEGGIPECAEGWRETAEGRATTISAYQAKYTGEYPYIDSGRAGIALLVPAPCRPEDLNVAGNKITLAFTPSFGERLTTTWDAPVPTSTT